MEIGLLSSLRISSKSMISRLTVLLLLALTIAGCATAYKSSGITGGYRETWLAPDVVRVSFRGNGYTARERAQDFALLRASELTLSHGYSYFAIMNEADTVSQSSFTTAGHSYSTGSVNFYGGSASYSGQTTYQPGQTHSGLLIKCFKNQPKGVDTFNASFLQSSIRQTYKIRPNP
jgi:hypothetical protein